MVVAAMRRRVIHSIAVACLALATISPLAGQDLGDAEDALARPRYMLFLFEVEPQTLSAQQEFLLYNSILSATAAATDAVVLLESPNVDVPTTREGREGLARSVNADSWLYVIVSGGFENLVVEVETFDLLRRETIGREVIRPGFAIDYRILSVGLWESVEATLQTGYERVVDSTELTVEALPGTEVGGLPGGPHVVGDSGSVVVPIPVSSAYDVLVDLPGHYRERRAIFVEIDPVTLSFEQFEQPQFGVDLRISSFQFIGARFWYYPVPAQVFVRAGFTTQAFGFFPVDNSERLLQQGSALSEFAIDGGIYISPAEQLLRFYTGGGFYLRLVHPSFSDLGLERDASNGFAFTAMFAGEFSTSRRLRFFLEYAPAYIFASDPQRFIDLSFARSTDTGDDIPGFVVTDGGVFDLRNVYLGARWDF